MNLTSKLKQNFKQFKTYNVKCFLAYLEQKKKKKLNFILNEKIPIHYTSNAIIQ